MKSEKCLKRLLLLQVSSTKDADANAVDDYMDYLESLSMEVLERVANMTDNNGNTALHYAVSHSQWDIVSLLLDSKVCYPQLRNKAGYSPPMLAALAQPVNSTELQVLHRLFSLADVNAKATQVRYYFAYHQLFHNYIRRVNDSK